MMRSQFSRERFLILPAAERDGFESHSAGVLDAKVTQAANPLHGDQITGACA